MTGFAEYQREWRANLVSGFANELTVSFLRILQTNQQCIEFCCDRGNFITAVLRGGQARVEIFGRNGRHCIGQFAHGFEGAPRQQVSGKEADEENERSTDAKKYAEQLRVGFHAFG